MKITDVESFYLEFPGQGGFSDSIHKFDRSGMFIIQVHTDEGITGTAHIGAGSYGWDMYKPLIDFEMKRLVVGEDPTYIKRIRQKIRDNTEYYGNEGLGVFGISMIDTALWDIKGKVAGMPVYKMLGPAREKVPCYGMVGWLNLNEEQLRRRATEMMEGGIHGVKVKVGSPTLTEDLDRIRVVRETVGPDFPLMVDANQIFTTAEALRRGQAYEEYDVYWFEEPLRPYNKDGLAELAAALTVRIATGENEYLKYAFRDLIVKGGVDIVQPDLRRCGGFTEELEVCALADAFNLPVATHGDWPVNVSLLCAAPNALIAEWGPGRFNDMLEVPFKVEDGYIYPNDVPGLGIEFNMKAIDKYRLR
jgi:L-alanine-DL-glutamate epimerase-like enolase superfamily enzyme